MSKLHTKKQLNRRKRYGMNKVKTGVKLCWLSRQNLHGWSLGLALNGRTVWLTNTRLASISEIKRALKSAVVYVHSAKSK